MFADDFDDYDLVDDMEAAEARLSKELELRAALARARDLGHVRREAALEELLAAIEEID